MMEDGFASPRTLCFRSTEPTFKKLVRVEHACDPINGEMRGRETKHWKLMG